MDVESREERASAGRGGLARDADVDVDVDVDCEELARSCSKRQLDVKLKWKGGGSVGHTSKNSRRVVLLLSRDRSRRNGASALVVWRRGTNGQPAKGNFQ